MLHNVTGVFCTFKFYFEHEGVCVCVCVPLYSYLYENQFSVILILHHGSEDTFWKVRTFWPVLTP